MKLILHLIGVIVEIEHDAVVVAERDQLAEQLGLGIELLGNFRPGAAPNRMSEHPGNQSGLAICLFVAVSRLSAP